MSSLKFAIKSLKNHKLRTALTVLAVSIGVAAVIIVMSAGQGLKSLIMAQINSFGSDLIQIEIKVPSAKKNSIQNARGVATGITITTLKDNDRKAILKEIPGVLEGYSGVIDQEQVVRGENRKKTFIFGTSASVLKVDPAEIETGRIYTESEEKGADLVAVLGPNIKETLFGSNNAIGKNIRIKQKRFRVIGVFKERGGAAVFNFDEMIYIPLKTLQRRIAGIDHVSFISVKTDQSLDQKILAEQIEQVLRERHSISDPSKDDFAVTTMEEAREMVDSILGAVQLLLLALAAISLIVGGVGIMNVMYVSVKERTFEIGLRKALGAKYKDILLQFLWESLIISLLGAAAGIIIGSSVSFGIARIALKKGFSWEFIIPASSLFVSVLFSSTTGILFGYWPAKNAAKKNAIEALVQA